MKISFGRQALLFLTATALAVGLLRRIDLHSRPAFPAIVLVKKQFGRDLDSLDRLVRYRLLPLAQSGQPTDSIGRTFLACRLKYKEIEAFTEYFFPATSRLVNGPALPEIEADDKRVFAPGGFQVLEEKLFPTVDTSRRDELVTEIHKLRSALRRYRTQWDAIELTDAHVFDALRLQLFRISSLGISGFDTPVCRTAIPESAQSTAAIGVYLSFYSSAQPVSFQEVLQKLQQAEAYLRTHPDFDAFDRSYFISRIANPLSTRLLDYGKQIGILPFNEVRALRADAATLFEPGVFESDFYAATVDQRTNPAKVRLGQKLFSDPILSGTGTRSCAGCHQPDRAFTDGLARNVTLTGKVRIPRNTPTILNAALQNGQFYDLRARTLEDQSLDVVHNLDEMRGSLTEASRKLERSSEYVTLFKKAFPAQKGRIDPASIQNALAAYERSLLRLDSRFDRYMRGDGSALSRQESQGFNLFMGKARCGSCHFAPLFNGTLPPVFTKTESEVLGVPIGPGQARIDPDVGRFAQTGIELLRYAFKTPTLRNIALTAPYMHNGAFRTLEEVVTFYCRGGGRGLGIPLDNQTLPGDKLALTAREKAALIAFMNALTDIHELASFEKAAP